ncbi:integrase family protein [Halogeometricum pallidum JCM 14848]|uniref:Integrase family protein n=1 Tax=Halogeometricum pallidum JCM 14848 TaxID=1227487 RepID=M0CW55_HALPD|nr:site-specific integrase [Halogeometricum pallidum]ELZ26672.1 integrase family protein [Halogeometricum pallidum JCM 14848]
MGVKPKQEVDRLRDRVTTSDEISSDDQERLIAFSDQMYLLKSEYGLHRHVKLLRHCTRMAEEVGGLTDALESRNAAENLVGWINRNYDNEETNRDYRVALRMFAKRVTEDDEIPPSIEWVPADTSRNYDPKPSPGEMLRWEGDILPMIDATMNARDAAFIAVAWDSGARSGELRELRVGDVTDHKHGLQITVDGKTGQRTITLIPSVPYLQRWLQDHPRKGDSGAPLWCKLQSGEEMSYQMFRKLLIEAADRAGVTKPVTITNFRKSSASFLASQNVNQARIEDHHGWTRGSSVASRYIAIFGGESDRALARAHGLDVEDETPDPIAPNECPRCQRETPRHEEFCVWCGQALEPGAVETVKEREREVREAVFHLVEEDPGILTERERISDLMTLADEYPGLFDDAERFVAALNDG